MNKSEIAKAKKMLNDRAERFETMICGNGQCLTAYWIDGGQKVFYSLDEVREHIESHC